MYLCTDYESPIGTMTLASNGDAVCGLWFMPHKYRFASIPEEPTRDDGDPALVRFKEWLDAYFARRRPAIDEVALAPEGTSFRMDVWDALKRIPYGETVSYGELAQEVARKRGKASPRSIGGAVGHNPISVIIPCHRVVGADGSLTGFGGGIDKKVALLAHEGVDMSRFFLPKRGTAL